MAIVVLVGLLGVWAFHESGQTEVPMGKNHVPAMSLAVLVLWICMIVAMLAVIRTDSSSTVRLLRSRLFGDFATFFINRGINYHKLGQYQRAIDDYNEAIRLKPHYADAYINRGSAYFKLTQYQRAIDDYSEAIHLKPDYIDVYINRGLAYSMQGNNKLVCRDAHKACDLGNCIMLESPKGREFCR
jgi:tetratricopeptide (TPR) repeat protein